MKKIFLSLLCIVFVLSAFASCDQAEESKTDISDIVSETVSEALPEQSEEVSEDASEESVPEESTPDESVPEVSLPDESAPEVSLPDEENNNDTSKAPEEDVSKGEKLSFVITDNRHLSTLRRDAIDEFYYADGYVYYLASQPEVEYIIVEYSDGTTQNIREAFEDGNITLADLDAAGIEYFKDKLPD